MLKTTMTPYEMLQKLFGTLPPEGCLIEVRPPEPSGRIPFTVYDPSHREPNGGLRTHRCGVSCAILEDQS